MKLITKLAIFATLLTLATGSFAQGRGGFGGGFGRGGGQQSVYRLLSRKDVQADLKLTDDQKTKLTDLQAKMREEMQAARDNASASGGGGDPTAMRDAMKKITDTYKPQFDAILTPDQSARLKQINVQMQKNSAILDPDVQTELGITADQKAKIDDLQTKSRAAMMEIFGKVRNGEMDQAQARPLFQKNMDIMNDELGKILTPEQTQKLKDMAGPTFTATDPERGPGGRGGGGGGK